MREPGDPATRERLALLELRDFADLLREGVLAALAAAAMEAASRCGRPRNAGPAPGGNARRDYGVRYPRGYRRPVRERTTMCSKATCRKCGKTTWAGCGMHVKQVMRGVPADKQCTCGSSSRTTGGQAAASVARPTGGRLRALLRRS